jgi:PAS domain S-box-containing protein
MPKSNINNEIDEKESGKHETRIVKENQRVIIPILIGLLFFSIAALWGLNYVWLSGLKGEVSNQESVWSERYAKSEANITARRMRAVEQSLSQMLDNVAQWNENGSDIRIIGNSLSPRGKAWLSEGDEINSEVVTFAHQSMINKYLSNAGGDEFDPLARGVLLVDPMIEAVGLVTLKGVVRRLPGERVIDRVRNLDQLQNLKPLREVAKTRARGTAWYFGGSLSSDPPPMAVGAAQGVVVEGIISSVLFVEIDGASLLPEVDSSELEWTVLVDRTNTVISLDSIAAIVIGRGRINLKNHDNKGVSSLGEHLSSKREGIEIIHTNKGLYRCSFTEVPGTNWQLVVARPVVDISKKYGTLSTITIIALSVGSILLILFTLFGIRLSRKKFIYQAKEIDNLDFKIVDAIATIGTDQPFSEIGDVHDEFKPIFAKIRSKARIIFESGRKKEREKEKLESILRSVDVGVAVMDKRFNVTYANNVTKERHGLHIIGGRASWIVEDTAWDSADISREVMESKSPHTVRREIRVKGESRIFQTTYFPLTSVTGNVEGFGEVTTDVTELAHLQSKVISDVEVNEEVKSGDLWTTKYMLGKFKNYRRMLNIILNKPVDLKNQDSKKSEECENYINMITENSEKVRDQIDEILRITEINSGQFNLRVRPFMINDMLELVEEEIKSSEPKENLDVTLKMLPANLILRNDHDQIKLILVNLLRNAIENCDMGTVSLSAAREENNIIFTIFDTGKGINEAIKEQFISAFEEPFDMQKVVESDINSKLLVVIKTVSLLQGTISVQSRSGIGTTYIVTLPRDLE